MAETHNIATGLSKLKMPIEVLVEDEMNARLHEDRSIKAIKESLSRFGQQKPIVLREDGKSVLAGNGTLRAAKELGWTQIAAVKTKLKGEEAAAYSIADNRTAELSTWDLGALEEHIGSFDTLDGLGFTMNELAELFKEEDTEAPTLPEADSTAEEAIEETNVKFVQLYFEPESYDKFITAVQNLAEVFGTDNVTDTVLNAVLEAYNDRQTD